VILNNDVIIKKEHLSFLYTDKMEKIVEDHDSIVIDLPEEGIDFRDLQRLIMQKILNRFEGNKSRAADYLRISRKTLYDNKITH
jgi:transcriptional regulator with PAS, ATPase and Fis domain